MSESVENLSILIKLPSELKKKYHMMCIQNGISMKDELIKHIKEYVHK
jgi:hypothetical protein